MELLQQLAKDNGIQLEGRPDNSDQERVLAVLTRAQKKKLQHQQSIQDKDLEEIPEDNSAIPHNTTKTLEEEETPDQNPMLETEADNDFYAGQEFPFIDELFGEQRKQKELLSRGQRRRHCQCWVKKGNYSSTMQLKKKQEQDPDVQKWVKQEDPTRIKCVEGLLCRVWHPKQTPNITYEQIVLPKRYQQQVIKIAHDIPFAQSSWT